MTGELNKTATAVDASLSYLKKEITPGDLEGCCTSWEGVLDYQCQEFVQSVLAVAEVTDGIGGEA